MKIPRRIRGENPCKHCDDRDVGCHSGCDRYLNWRQEYLSAKEEAAKAKRFEDVADDYTYSTRRRLHNAKGERNG